MVRCPQDGSKMLGFDGVIVCTVCGRRVGDPKPFVTVPREQVGDLTSVGWRLVAGMTSRTRADRLESARWVLDHPEGVEDHQLEAMRGIIDGSMDAILQKEIENGLEPA